MEPVTEREIIIKMDGKIDAFDEKLERLVAVIERIENVKFEGHEQRIKKLEAFQNKWIGACLVFSGLALFISIIIGLKQLFG